MVVVVVVDRVNGRRELVREAVGGSRGFVCA